MNDRFAKAVSDRARRYIINGMDREAAIRKAVDESFVNAPRLGDDGVVAQATQVAEKVKGVVSPWLWLLSGISFVLAIVNHKRIATMFGGWRRGREAIKRGEAP